MWHMQAVRRFISAEAKVAQLVEHSTENAGVVGSIPSLGTNKQTYKALSHMRSGLRLLSLTNLFLIDSKAAGKKVIFVVRRSQTLRSKRTRRIENELFCRREI